MKLTRNKIRFIGVAAVLMVTAIFLGIVGKAHTQYSEAKVQFKDKEKDLVSVKAEIIEIQESLDDYEEEKAEFSKLLFSEQDIPAFLDGIAQFAIDSEVTILDMQTQEFRAVVRPKKQTSQPSTVRRKAPELTPEQERDRILTLSALPIQIKVHGEYASFVEFLAQLEDFDQLLTISDVHIMSDREYPLLQCDFKLKLYSLKTLEELDQT